LRALSIAPKPLPFYLNFFSLFTPRYLQHLRTGLIK
jgi:hypothetical protein